MNRKFKCIKSYHGCAGNEKWLTKGNIYELSEDGKFTMDDGYRTNLNGKFGNEWAMSYLEEIKEEDKKVRERSIHISTDGTSTHAVLKDGKSVIKRAKVGLYHGDEYKFETGVIEVVKKLFDIKEDSSKPFIKAKVGDRIRIINNNGEHYPEVNNGDIHKVVEVWGSWVNTNKENSFYDDDKEYEIIESTKDLSDYTTDELLAEIRIRSVR